MASVQGDVAVTMDVAAAVVVEATAAAAAVSANHEDIADADATAHPLPHVPNEYDSIGTDEELARDLTALSVYDDALKQAKTSALAGGDGNYDQQAAHDYATAQLLQHIAAEHHQGSSSPSLSSSSFSSANSSEAVPSDKRGESASLLPTSRPTLAAAKQAKQAKSRAAHQPQAQTPADAVGSPSAPSSASSAPNDKQENDADDGADEPVFTASPGHGQAIPPLQFMVDAKSGDVAMSRMPLNSQEWIVTFNAMANDLNTRFFSDPMWLDHARAQFQELQTLEENIRRHHHQATSAKTCSGGGGGSGSSGASSALEALEAQKAAAIVSLQQSFYDYLAKLHCELLRTQYRLVKADVVLGMTCKNLKPYEITPVGCGELHAAMLCNTERHPKRFHLLYALLTCDKIVAYADVEKAEGVLNAGKRARTACWPRYQLASGFVLSGPNGAECDVVIQHVNIHKQVVVVCYCPVGQLDLHVGIHSLGMPSNPTTAVRLAGIMATASWRVACNGRFLVVAHNNGQAYDRQGRLAPETATAATGGGAPPPDYPPNTLQVWWLGVNAPRLCFTLSLDAVEDDQQTAALDKRPAVITSMCFDVNVQRENYLCVATRDLRAITFALPTEDPDAFVSAGGTLQQYRERAFELIGATTKQCFVAPTKARELEIASADPQHRPKNSMREPAEVIQTYHGYESRMAVITRNNFMLKTLCGFGRQPTINEHLESYNNLMLGTLPVIYQHGAADMQSIACAGNLFVGHFCNENDIVVANMRDKAQLAYIKGSMLLGYSPPENISSDDAANPYGSGGGGGDESMVDKAKAIADAERERQELLARADPYRPWYYYQSTWATLSRVVVQMVDGTLIILEPVTSSSSSSGSGGVVAAAAASSMLTPQQAAGAMFAASKNKQQRQQ